MIRKNFTVSVNNIQMLNDLSKKLNLTSSDIVRRSIELFYEQKIPKMDRK